MKQALNALHKVASLGGHRRFLRGQLLCSTAFKLNQRGCVRGSIAAPADHRIVTTVFALAADNASHPPRGRMIKQQAFQDSLAHVHQIVCPDHMREFMQQDRLHLIGGEGSEESKRNQDQRPQMAQHHPRIGQNRFQQQNRTRNTGLNHKLAQPFLPRTCRRTLPRCCISRSANQPIA